MVLLRLEPTVIGGRTEFNLILETLVVQQHPDAGWIVAHVHADLPKKERRAHEIAFSDGIAEGLAPEWA